MIEFKRNKATGIVEAWKDGKKVGDIVNMGDLIDKESVDEDKQKDENDK